MVDAVYVIILRMQQERRRCVASDVNIRTIVGCHNHYESWDDRQSTYSASLRVVLAICCLFSALSNRMFALKAQPHCVRPNRICGILALPLPDPALSTKQLIAQRFVHSVEFVTPGRPSCR